MKIANSKSCPPGIFSDWVLSLIGLLITLRFMKSFAFRLEYFSVQNRKRLVCMHPKWWSGGLLKMVSLLSDYMSFALVLTRVCRIFFCYPCHKVMNILLLIAWHKKNSFEFILRLYVNWIKWKIRRNFLRTISAKRHLP